MRAILGGQRTVRRKLFIYLFIFPQESVLLKVFFQAQHVTMIFNKNTVEYIGYPCLKLIIQTLQ